MNTSLLNLIVKILKTKIIYCTKCNKIFHWTEHYSVCPESGFKETDEILGELKQLVNSCIQLIESEYKINSSSEENSDSEVKIYDYKDSIKKLKNKSKINNC